MEAAGQHRIVRAEDVAHMGITEVLRHAPFIFGQYRKLVASLQRDRPALAILIDFPDVNFRLARHCKRLGIPVLWFVSPQLWAWKRRRLRWVQQRVDRMMVIFPFEAAFYRNRQVNAEFVGHPLATEALTAHSSHLIDGDKNALFPSREAYAAQHGLDPAKQWIALLPGSREKELDANISEMVGAAAILGTAYEYIVPVASTITHNAMETQLMLAADFPGKNPAFSGVFQLVPDARAALHHARASIVASGTATVQALTIGNPFVVVYRVSPLTFALAKRLIRYPAEVWDQTGDQATLKDADGNLPIAMPNLIAGRRIVPELLNDRFTAANLAAALGPLLEDTPARARMIADLAETRARLLPPDPTSNPIHRVCDAALELLNTGPAATRHPPQNPPVPSNPSG
jgi:lipid-A-disaccharide synthase